MNPACEAFLGLLEDSLSRSGALARLGAHEHPRTCAACAASWRRERALDGLLGRVPEPRGPADLGRRVLAGLAAARAGEPSGEATGSPSDGDLDEMLRHLPAPAVPAGLPARVLAGLAEERAPALLPQPRRHRRWPLATLAAVLLALLGAWIWLGGRVPRSPEEELWGDLAELELDEELLLYAADRWELLNDDDLDVWLASLDPEEALLMEFFDGDAGIDPGRSAR